MILLDTHTLIWLAAEPVKLSRKAADAIRASAGEGGGLAISGITLWELAWLATHGRVSIAGTAEAFVHKITSRTAILPITAQIAVLANQFPETFSKDPADRIIGATALANGIALVTKDANLRRSRQLRCVW